MSLFFSYLKQQLKYILLFLLFSITFAITFFFYNFPIGSVDLSNTSMRLFWAFLFHMGFFKDKGITHKADGTFQSNGAFN